VQMQQIDATDRYHVCGATKADSSGITPSDWAVALHWVRITICLTTSNSPPWRARRRAQSAATLKTSLLPFLVSSSRLKSLQPLIGKLHRKMPCAAPLENGRARCDEFQTGCALRRNLCLGEQREQLMDFHQMTRVCVLQALLAGVESLSAQCWRLVFNRKGSSTQ
jgi:hypothetical protein